MQQVERLVTAATICLVQQANASDCGVDDCPVRGGMLACRIEKVAKQCEAHLTIAIGEELDLDVIEGSRHPLGAPEQQRNDDDRPMMLRDGIRKVETRKPRCGDEEVHQLVDD